jgi:hypothetical protein
MASAPFPTPAHQTEHADFRHSAFRRLQKHARKSGPFAPPSSVFWQTGRRPWLFSIKAAATLPFRWVSRPASLDDLVVRHSRGPVLLRYFRHVRHDAYEA